MGQNAAQPLLDIRDKLASFANMVTSYDKGAAEKKQKPDTSWHDSMVDAATASFAKKPKKPVSPSVSSSSKKRSAKKGATRRKIAPTKN